MSRESARAFCMRLMADEEFQQELAKAPDAATVSQAVKREGFDFNQHDLLKIVSEMAEKALSLEEFKAMVSEFYSGELAKDNPNAAAIVTQWIDQL